MFRATICPLSGEITVSKRHFVFVTLRGWLSGMQGGMKLQYRKCRIDTVISPDDGHIVARNMYRKEINILRKILHQVGFIYKIIQGCTVNKTQKPVHCCYGNATTGYFCTVIELQNIWYCCKYTRPSVFTWSAWRLFNFKTNLSTYFYTSPHYHISLQSVPWEQRW